MIEVNHYDKLLVEGLIKLHTKGLIVDNMIEKQSIVVCLTKNWLKRVVVTC
jgi:hypothetical protein